MTSLGFTIKTSPIEVTSIFAPHQYFAIFSDLTVFYIFILNQKRNFKFFNTNFGPDEGKFIPKTSIFDPLKNTIFKLSVYLSPYCWLCYICWCSIQFTDCLFLTFLREIYL